MAGALKEMQSEGKADQVFQPISASNGSILRREEDYQPVIKVTSTICCFVGYIFINLFAIYFYLTWVYMNMKVCICWMKILLMWLDRDAFIVHNCFVCKRSWQYSLHFKISANFWIEKTCFILFVTLKNQDHIFFILYFFVYCYLPWLELGKCINEVYYIIL